MKRRDLVVVHVGRNKRLRREAVLDLADMLLRQAQFFETISVRLVVLANRGHDQRIAIEHLETVGNIAGTAAELASHVGDQKCHVQNMNLVRQDVVLETVAEHHDGVVGNRSANQRSHSLIVFLLRMVYLFTIRGEIPSTR